MCLSVRGWLPRLPLFFRGTRVRTTPAPGLTHLPVRQSLAPDHDNEFHRLTSRMHYSEPEEVSGSTAGEAVDSSAAAVPALCGPSNATLTEEVNTVPASQSRVEADETAAVEASPVIVRTSRARDRAAYG